MLYNPEKKINENIEKFFEKKELSPDIFKDIFYKLEKFDEGSDGVILLLDSDKINQEERNALKKEGILENGDTERIFKLLKVYQPGSAEKEVSNQARAQEIIDQSENNDELAKIPQVRGCFEISLNQMAELEEYLSACHLKINEEHKVELIVMDLVQGVDFRTFILQKLLEKDEYLKEEFKKYKKSLHIEKNSEVSSLILKNFMEMHLGFVDPPYETSFDFSWQYGKNIEKLKNALRKANVVLPKEIFETLQNTLKCFHEKGFYHNDLHEKNILIDKNFQVFLIDFFYSGAKEKEYSLDETVALRWQEFSKTEEEKKSQQKEDFLKGTETLKIILDKDPLYSNIRQKIIKMLEDGSPAEKIAKSIVLNTDTIEPIRGDKHNNISGLLWKEVLMVDEELAKEVIGAIKTEIGQIKNQDKKRASSLMSFLNYWNKIEGVFV